MRCKECKAEMELLEAKVPGVFYRCPRCQKTVMKPAGVTDPKDGAHDRKSRFG